MDQVISSYSEVTFNRKVIQCAGVFDSVSQFEEGSASCISAQDALAEDCCIDSSNNDLPSGGNLAPAVITTEPQPALVETVDSSESSNASESSASESPNASESSDESSNVGSGSTTDTAFAINDQWGSYTPAGEGTPQQENKGTGDDSTQASWYADWKSSYKMKPSSCTKSVGASTVISVMVLGMNLAWN
jgi:U3 small nucleolar RNA-associated protein 14